MVTVLALGSGVKGGVCGVSVEGAGSGGIGECCGCGTIRRNLCGHLSSQKQIRTDKNDFAFMCDDCWDRLKFGFQRIQFWFHLFLRCSPIVALSCHMWGPFGPICLVPASMVAALYHFRLPF